MGAKTVRTDIAVVTVTRDGHAIAGLPTISDLYRLVGMKFAPIVLRIMRDHGKPMAPRTILIELRKRVPCRHGFPNGYTVEAALEYLEGDHKVTHVGDRSTRYRLI